MVFRTSSSQEEGGTRLFSRRTTKLEGGQIDSIAIQGVR